MHGKASVIVRCFLGVILSNSSTEPCRTMAAEPDPLRPPAISVESVPVVPGELMKRLSQYQNTRAAVFRGWCPLGKGMLIATRFGDTAQLHRVYEAGGRREQVTFFREPCNGHFLPATQDGALLLTMSQGGSENDQVYLLDRQSGRANLLTDGRSRNLLGPVREDGSQAVISNNSRNGRDTDIYLANPRRPDSLKLLMQVTNEFWTATDWSPDGTKLLVNRYVSINESYPGLLDTTSGEKKMLPIPGGDKASFQNLKFAPGGKSVYLTTDARGEFQELARFDLSSQKYEWLTSDIPWDVESIEVERQSGRVAFTINEDGASSLYLLEPQIGSKPQKVKLPLGVVENLEFNPNGQLLGFTLARPDAPGDAYALRISSGELTRWTYSEVGGLNPESFVVPTRFRFPSFDKREIPAFVYRPRSASPDKKAPVLINIHGGPESQSQPTFSGMDQYYSNELGIAVIYPNVRGSSGYGKTYLKLDNADKREDSVRDIGALLDWIAQQPDLDSQRVAVTGGSYGGYMVLGSLVMHGDRLKAGIDIVGIANFTTFLKNTSPYRQDLRRAEYGDERDPKMQAVFERVSPASHSDKIRSALLVAHGKNDPRVPFSEAEQIATKVRANGRTVWTVFADNEGHGFSKKPNRDYLTAVVAMFLRDNLTDDK